VECIGPSSSLHSTRCWSVPKRGGNGEPQISKHEERSYGGQPRAEWLLVAEQEPPLGSHVVTPRCGYQHRGIYIGDGKVVHYAGLAHGPHRRPVEDISLARFTGGHPSWVRSDATPNFDRREVILRARSRTLRGPCRLRFSSECIPRDTGRGAARRIGCRWPFTGDDHDDPRCHQRWR
jgi:hypothetical protein